MKKNLIPFILLGALGGCSVYQEEFECPIGKGESCASLGTVNDLADQGKYARTPVETRQKPNLRKKIRVYYPGTKHQMAG